LRALSKADPFLAVQLIGEAGHAATLLASLDASALGRVLSGGEVLLSPEQWSPEQAHAVGALVEAWHLAPSSVTALRIYRRSPDFVGVYLIRGESWIGTDLGWNHGLNRDAVRWQLAYYFGEASWQRVPFAQWETIQTEHVSLRYPPDSMWGDQPPAWYLGRFEDALLRICGVLGIDPPSRRVTVWLYDDDQHALLLRQRRLNFANPPAWEAHLRRTGSPGHEIAHVLLEYAWGERANEVMSEGLATWLDGAGGNDVRRLRRRYGSPRPPLLSSIARDFETLPETRGYPAAAMMVAWLHARHGLDALRTAYLAKDVQQAVMDVTGLPWDGVQASWEEWFRNAGREPPR
jgi:hypothetical protein